MPMLVRSIRLMTYSKKRNGNNRNDTLRKTVASLGAASGTATRFTVSDIRRLALEIPGVSGRPAAIDRENVAVHVTVFRIGQKQGCDGDLVGGGGPAERDVVEHTLDIVPEFAPFAVEQLPSPF